MKVQIVKSQRCTAVVAMLTLTAWLPACLSSFGKPATRPNIVFIFSDDHGWQAISAYGDSRKLIQTPNIDRLAHEGMQFDRCLVTDSLCGPSRATVLTGTYNHINGFYNNRRCVFDGSQTTFPKLLQKAGYQTAMIGKWHLVSDPTGFDYWNILPGQGQYYNPPMIQNGQRVKGQGYVTDARAAFDESLTYYKQQIPALSGSTRCSSPRTARTGVFRQTQGGGNRSDSICQPQLARFG
jgi:arylsulfatase A-like enzyme